MSTDSLPLQQLCQLAMQVARQAGEYIQGVDRTELRREFKAAGSSAASQVVTEVDLHCEAMIRAHLQGASVQWDIAFVGEESVLNEPGELPERLLKPFYWCVDPLDGTLPFVEGRPGYAVSIALLERSGAPLLGVVYDPVEATLLHAIKGRGAYRNLAPLEPAKSKSTSLMVFADASFEAHEGRGDLVGRLNACAQGLGLEGISLVCGSGAVKNACQILDHAAACYVKLPRAEQGGGSIWDFSATASIVAEAGAWVSNIHGQPLDLNRRDSSFMNHQGVLYASSERIAQYLVS